MNIYDYYLKFQGKSTLDESEFLDFKEFAELLIEKLNAGEIRAAEKNSNGNWQANSWVKESILLLFKFGKLVDYSIDDNFKYFDKNFISLKPFKLSDNVRIVPGGSSIRTGCYISPNVIIMPPAYINIGAYVDSGTMIDSHALVGSCAQLGKNIHLSAASQIGGVLEPANAVPVIIEDNVMIGGNCGIYEGIIVKKGAVLGSGVIITSSMKIYDLVNNKIIQKIDNKPLEIPENAVVVAGSRKIDTKFATENGLSLYTPLIIKYKDEKTSAKTALTDILR